MYGITNITNITVRGGGPFMGSMCRGMMPPFGGSLFCCGNPMNTMAAYYGAGNITGSCWPMIKTGCEALYNGVLKPVGMAAFNYVLKPLWNNVISPVGKFVYNDILRPLGNGLKWVWDNSLGWVFKKMGNLGHKNTEKAAEKAAETTAKA